jgi:hypothetical protein
LYHPIDSPWRQRHKAAQIAILSISFSGPCLPFVIWPFVIQRKFCGEADMMPILPVRIAGLP